MQLLNGSDQVWLVPCNVSDAVDDLGPRETCAIIFAMQLDDLVDRLNALSEPAEAAKKPLTLQRVQELFRHPPKLLDFDPGMGLVTSIVAAFTSANPSARLRLVSRLSKNSSNPLLSYAYKMAIDAVRQTSPELVVRGLAALAIEGGRIDIRDSIIPMALLHHSALKLGMDVKEVFSTSASLSSSASLIQAMRSFPQREPENKELKAFY